MGKSRCWVGFSRYRLTVLVAGSVEQQVDKRVDKRLDNRLNNSKFRYFGLPIFMLQYITI
nr:MAG: hypothetical protein EDM05_14245 [Leptolyngbya sp. IPPAS B-1204]